MSTTALVDAPTKAWVRFFTGTGEQAARLVVEHAIAKKGGYVVFCNVHVLMDSRTDGETHLALADAWKVFPDGAPIAWLQRRLGGKNALRVSGPDLMPAVIDLGRARGVRHFLFGSQPDVLSALRSRPRRATRVSKSLVPFRQEPVPKDPSGRSMPFGQLLLTSSGWHSVHLSKRNGCDVIQRIVSCHACRRGRRIRLRCS